MRHRATLALLVFGLALLLVPAKAAGQTPPVTDDEVKVSIYKRFVENWEPNPPLAYEAAKEYMRRYGKEEDQYTRYFKVWIPAYEEDLRERKVTAERADREQQLLGTLTQKKFAEAIEAFRQLALLKPGDGNAQSNLGVFYQYERGGLSKDEAEAAKWYRKSAEQGNSAGEYHLGRVPPDVEHPLQLAYRDDVKS